MGRTITIAQRHQQAPSKVLQIQDEYLAYMLDETALFLESEAMDKDGNIRLDKLNWSDKRQVPATANGKKKTVGTNADLINFIQGR